MDDFHIKTTAQVERTYIVKADSAEAARKRLRIFLDDPDVIGADIVSHLASIDTTPERLKSGNAPETPAPAAKKKAAPAPDETEDPANDEDLPF